MNKLFMRDLLLNMRLEARKKADQDPRYLELKTKIAELEKEQRELSDKLTNEIFKEMKKERFGS